MNSFNKNEKWPFLDFNYTDVVTQHINTGTQQMLICRYYHVCLHMFIHVCHGTNEIQLRIML